MYVAKLSRGTYPHMVPAEGTTHKHTSLPNLAHSHRVITNDFHTLQLTRVIGRTFWKVRWPAARAALPAAEKPNKQCASTNKKTQIEKQILITNAYSISLFDNNTTTWNDAIHYCNWNFYLLKTSAHARHTGSYWD